jgi:Chaperone for flagella basal body P-ring formation
MERRVRRVLLLVTTTLANCLNAQSLVSTADVQHALSLRNVLIDVRQVDALPVLPKASESAQVAVEDARAWTGSTARIRLRCRTAGECLPFVTMVTWPSESAMRNAVQSLQASTVKSKTNVSDRILVKSGAKLTLLIDGDHSQISMPVVALQSGRAGQTIRVVSSDRSHFYSAQIVNREVVREAL